MIGFKGDEGSSGQGFKGKRLKDRVQGVEGARWKDKDCRLKSEAPKRGRELQTELNIVYKQPMTNNELRCGVSDKQHSGFMLSVGPITINWASLMTQPIYLKKYPSPFYGSIFDILRFVFKQFAHFRRIGITSPGPPPEVVGLWKTKEKTVEVSTVFRLSCRQ